MKLRTALLAICTASMLWIASTLAAHSATRRVVLLFGQRPELPGLALLQADLVRTLTSNSADRIEVYNETMDLERFGSSNYQLFLRDFLQAKYADKKIDLAIAILTPSLDFLLNYGSVIFPGTPIIFCGVDKTQLGNRSLPPNFGGILLKREFAPTVEIALSLHPNTERAVVVTGTSEFDTKLLEQAKIEFGFYENRLDFQYLTTLPLQNLLTELSGLPPRTLVFYTSLFRDGAGETYIPSQVAKRISAAANAPTYGFLDQYVGQGIVGGDVYSLSAHGVEMAKLALRVLAGTEAPQVSEVATNKLLFDWRQLHRWGISESKLPAGSEILFRESSAWEQYKLQILAITAAILTQALLIAWLLRERHYRRRAERTARETFSELTHMNRMATASELSAAIAHEIRQPITGIVTLANAALRWLSSSGIDLANLKRLFEPMFTTKARGMGMGLSICKSIIESHQGRIWVTAGASRGSIFQFELPTGGTTH